MIPRTYADDNDPLDVLVLSSEVIQPLSLVRCYPIGVITMLDQVRLDEKIIAIPVSYTHLDVYKRQRQGHSTTATPPFCRYSSMASS